jgi:hypothetical protein
MSTTNMYDWKAEHFFAWGLQLNYRAPLSDADLMTLGALLGRLGLLEQILALRDHQIERLELALEAHQEAP